MKRGLGQIILTWAALSSALALAETELTIQRETRGRGQERGTSSILLTCAQETPVLGTCRVARTGGQDDAAESAKVRAVAPDHAKKILEAGVKLLAPHDRRELSVRPLIRWSLRYGGKTLRGDQGAASALMTLESYLAAELDR